MPAGETNLITILNSKYDCTNPQWRTLNWVVPHPLMIDGVYTWAGAARGFRGDLHTHLNRIRSDGLLMAEFGFMQWDRYAEPTGPYDKEIMFKKPMHMKTGDIIQSVYYASRVGEQYLDPWVPPMVHHFCQLYFDYYPA